MHTFYSPKKISNMVEFVEKCGTPFPVRLNVQRFFTGQPVPTILVAFDDYQAMLYAWNLGQSLELLNDIAESILKLMSLLN